MNVSAIPNSWHAVLARIHTIAPEALLAGGALRDLDNNRPVKDLDVFVNDRTDFNILTAALSEFYPDRVSFKDYQHTSVYHENDNTVASVSLYEGSLLPPLNVIGVYGDINPMGRFARFDFGLCQIAFNGQHMIETEAYRHDRANRLLTMIRCESLPAFQRSLVRYHRLTGKYVDWPLVIPTKYVRYATDTLDF